MIVLSTQFTIHFELSFVFVLKCIGRNLQGRIIFHFHIFNLPAGAELVLEAEELLLPLVGAEEGSFIVIPFKVSALNVDFDFKIDLIVFGPETGSTPVSFSSGGRGCYRLKIHPLNHNQSLKSQRQQLSGQLCFFVTHLRVRSRGSDFILLVFSLIIALLRNKFEVGDRVLLKVTPWKGIVHFGKKGKLAPRYVGPFEILERIGLVAYRLRLPKELNSMHYTFHVSNSKKCLADANLHVPLNEIKIDKTLRLVEEPVEIMDREVKSLKRSRIPLMKVRWNSKRGPGFTWECEDYMKSKYP
ncbi:hypothetical protein Tco_0424930 [Tanacetum coccineum]